MKVIGFNFSKLSVEDTRDSKKSLEGVKVNTGMDILNIIEIKSDLLKTKEEVLGVDFEYKVDYDPSFAKVNIKGKVLVTLDPKDSKEVLKEWKSKKIPTDFRIFIFNIILRKATLKALQLEDELNLPLHIPMPSFTKNEEKK